MSRPRVLLSWSSGKDAAWTLHTLQQAGDVDVVGLLTSLNAEFDRVAMHAVRRTLLEAQAEAVGLPLVTVPLPWPCTNADYERLMLTVLADARDNAGITHVAFGDLFLEDVRDYRIQQLRGTGLELLFPVWGLPTEALAREMIANGIQARLTCVDPRKVPADWAGRAFDADLLAEMPDGVDPCGEAGEFHSFAWDGPIFAYPVAVTVGEVVERDGFVFADLLPADA